MEHLEDFKEAAEQGLRRLVSGYVKNEKYKNKTAIELLNMAIGYGGGHTLMKRVGPYWLIDYSPGIKVTLTRDEDETSKYPKDIVPRAHAITIVERIINEERNRGKQLELF